MSLSFLGIGKVTPFPNSDCGCEGVTKIVGSQLKTKNEKAFEFLLPNVDIAAFQLVKLYCRKSSVLESSMQLELPWEKGLRLFGGAEEFLRGVWKGRPIESHPLGHGVYHQKISQMSNTRSWEHYYLEPQTTSFEWIIWWNNHFSCKDLELSKTAIWKWMFQVPGSNVRC